MAKFNSNKYLYVYLVVYMCCFVAAMSAHLLTNKNKEQISFYETCIKSHDKKLCLFASTKESN